jgi:hypothetical protein
LLILLRRPSSNLRFEIDKSWKAHRWHWEAFSQTPRHARRWSSHLHWLSSRHAHNRPNISKVGRRTTTAWVDQDVTTSITKLPISGGQTLPHIALYRSLVPTFDRCLHTGAGDCAIMHCRALQWCILGLADLFLFFKFTYPFGEITSSSFF